MTGDCNRILETEEPGEVRKPKAGGAKEGAQKQVDLLRRTPQRPQTVMRQTPLKKGFERWGGAGCVAHAHSPAFRKAKREQCHEFGASLGCIVNSRLARSEILSPKGN